MPSPIRRYGFTRTFTVTFTRTSFGLNDDPPPVLVRTLPPDPALLLQGGEGAPHGPLRALVKYLEGISDTDIVDVNIPNGVPLVYEFDADFNVISKRYIGDVPNRSPGTS